MLEWYEVDIEKTELIFKNGFPNGVFKQTMKDEASPSTFGVISLGSHELKSFIGFDHVYVNRYCEVECELEFDFVKIECISKDVNLNLDSLATKQMLSYLKERYSEYSRVSLYIRNSILNYTRWNNIKIKTKEGFVTEIKEELHEKTE